MGSIGAVTEADLTVSVLNQEPLANCLSTGQLWYLWPSPTFTNLCCTLHPLAVAIQTSNHDEYRAIVKVACIVCDFFAEIELDLFSLSQRQNHGALGQNGFVVVVFTSISKKE